MQQQYPDQRPGPGPVAEIRSGGVPEALMGRRERPAPACRGQGGGPGQGPGLADQHLEVVIQHQVLGELVQGPGVGGHDRPGGDHRDRGSPQPHVQAPSGVAGRHGVVGLANAHPRPGIHPAREVLSGVEGLDRQRTQPGQLPHSGGPDGLGAPGDPPGVVGGIGGGHDRVELGQGGDRRQRDEVTAAEPADLALDPALLMGALNPGLAEEAVEAVVRTQRDEPRVLHPLTAQHHPHHRRGEVVIADHPRRHPAQPLERGHVTIQEGLLGLIGVGDVHGLARVRQAQDEHPQLHPHPADHRGELPEVDLSLLGRDVSLGHFHLQGLIEDLPAQLAHQGPHAGLGHDHPFLLDQPLPHPPGGVALLGRHILVGDQPSAHRGHVWPQHRSHPDGDFPRRRRRIGQRLTHRAPVHFVLLGQGPDREAFIAAVSSDTFELLHSRHLLQRSYPQNRLARRFER